MGIGASLKSGKEPSAKEIEKVFKEFDKDKSGSVDEKELVCMLDDLKLAKESEEENRIFMEKMLNVGMAQADENGDGLLNLKEFTYFVKFAARECAGKKPPPPPKKAAVKGKDAKALGPKFTWKATFLYAKVGKSTLSLKASGMFCGSVARCPLTNRLTVLGLGDAASKLMSKATTASLSNPGPTFVRDLPPE
jgi:hypothetical protein